jgi:EAL domain-containing protein (putative c-di-GMP-specific phosphodiesterase class I)
MLELHEVIRDVTDPMVVLRRVVDQALHAMPHADGAVVELLHAGELHYVCTGGTLGPSLGLRLNAGTSLSGLAIRRAVALCCDDSETDDRVDREACRRVGARSLLAVPLRRGDNAVGVVKITAAEPHAFDADDIAVLSRLADFITVSITAAAEIARISADVAQFNSRASSEFVANVLDPGSVDDLDARRRVRHALEADDFAIVCQPIVCLQSRTIVGAEALARFPGPPQLTPDVWFADAHRAGLGPQLELAAVAKAVRLLDVLPPTAYLTINVGPEVLAAPELPQLLETTDPSRIVLELTEHFPVEDYERLRGALSEIRRRGTRLAIDDTGAGFASLAHILKLSPEIIKLDRDLARGIDADPVRRSLAAALVAFATQIDATVVAEGLETEAELEAVRALGIELGQGYLLGRPGTAGDLAPRFARAA